MDPQKIVNFIFSIATGKSIKKHLFTPVLATFFFSITLSFVLVPLFLDKALNIPDIFNRPLNYILSLPIVLAGILLVLWSFLFFLKARGTPVPVNPPQRLISGGPYAYSRNPMTTGLFLQMFGVGIYFGSALSIFIFTPLYILMHVIELKKIEEPELEKRLGEEYLEYKKKVPMFFPRRFYASRT